MLTSAVVILAGQASSARTVANSVPLSEMLTFLALTGSTLVFLVGFASVRLHAHTDHIIERHETLMDRTVETAFVQGSFPWPHELQGQEMQIFGKAATQDRAANLTLVFCTLVAAVAVLGASAWIGIDGFLTGLASPDTDHRAIWGIEVLAALQLFVLGLMVFDRREISDTIRKAYRQGVGSRYADAAALLDSQIFTGDNWKVAAEKFRALQNVLPRWPWAMLGTGLALYIGNPGNALAKQLGNSIRDEVQHISVSGRRDPIHPIDRALLQASNWLTGGRIDDKELNDLEQYQGDYPDLKQVIGWMSRFRNQFPGARST